MQYIGLVLGNTFSFAWMQYGFMRNAFLAILIITPLFGILGTMTVHHKMAFFTDALGHSAFTGIAIGVILGGVDANLSMVFFGLVFAFVLNWIKRKQILGMDTIISVLSSLSIAAGLAILSQGGDFSKYSNLMVGDILSIRKQDIFYLFIIFIVTVSFWWGAFNQLYGIGLHRSLAKSKGISVEKVENIYTGILAVIVMLSIKWVGILIINALIILPAAASRNISENVREYHFFSILFSIFSGILGLIISFYIHVATGPTIVIIAAIIFFATYLYGKS